MIRFTIKNIEIEVVERIDSISSLYDNYYKIKSCEDAHYNFYGNDVIRVKSIRIKSCDDKYEEFVYIGKLVDSKFMPAFMITYECKRVFLKCLPMC